MAARPAQTCRMSTLAEIEQAVDQLSPEELRNLLKHVIERACLAPQPSGPLPDRIPGLHAGQGGWVADDIMDPLPDDIWEHNKE